MVDEVKTTTPLPPAPSPFPQSTAAPEPVKPVAPAPLPTPEPLPEQNQERQAAPEPARPMAINPVTGVFGTPTFNGTKPEDIAKMAPQVQHTDLPMGPGVVTGGAGLNMTTKRDKPIATGGDRTPGQNGNPSAEDADRQSRAGGGLVP